MANTKREQAAVSTVVAEDMSGLTLSFANGKTLVLLGSSLTEDVLRYAALHGLKQKLIDAAAIGRDPETGRSATIDDKYNAVRAVYDRLLAGQWNAPRGEGTATGGFLFAALCRMYDGKRTPEELREFLAGKSDAEKSALRRNPKVAAIIETIRAERAKSSDIDTDSMLDELANDEGV